ncbi:hypothetical protein ScPMuIL_015262 [Solemya velum]
MPPKKDSAKKGGKLSKADKEKLKLEEEERKAQEEEEAKQKAEEEENRRKEKERLAAREAKQLEDEEKRQRLSEMSEIHDIIEANKAALYDLHDERRKKAKWARYMRCDGSPDPTVAGEINTYINLRLEDKSQDDVDSVLKDGDSALKLIRELEFLLDDTPESELNVAERASYKTTIEDLHHLIETKLDAATQNLLCQATSRANPETFNLQFFVKNSDIALCVWGNLSKNPRVKSFEFGEKGFTFDIPRILTIANCAFRVLFTQYDQFSPRSKYFYPRMKKKEEPTPPVEEEKKDEEGKEKTEGDGEEEKKDEEEDVIDKAGSEDTTDLMAALNDLEKEQNGEQEEEEVEEKVEEEAVDEYDDPDTPEPIEWEDLQEDDDVVDLRANHVLGGVFHFNLLNLPPQPKSMKSWVITRLVDPPEINYLDYVADSVAASPILLKEKDEKDKDKSQENEKKKDEKPAIGINMRLPETVLFTEEPQMARWDHENNYWRLDGFSDFKYDEENRMFQFKTGYFGTMALLQDAHINMPFQSWELRPHATNAALLTIIAAIVEIEIEIKEAMCCLSKPDDKPELDHLRMKWLTPKELIRGMRQAGVNVFPAEDSPKYVSIQDKQPAVEDRLYRQMSMMASAMAFSWSKWNTDVQDREKILFQGSECLRDEPLMEDEWSLYMVTKKRSLKLKMTEFDETFSDEIAEGTPHKSNMYHLLMDIGTADAKERVRNTNYQFSDCVYQLLSATKLTTYS